VRIADQHGVTTIERRATGTFLVGGGFTVEARRVIVATDAVAQRTIADPWPERTITVALQTESVPGLARVIGLERPFYTSELPLLWGRPLPDGSLLFGRELIEWAAGTPPARSAALVCAAGQRLAGRVRALHPVLGSIGIRRIWAGPTARTGAGVPGLVFDPDGDTVLWAGGYGGHGLAQAFVVGRMAAAWVCGRDISPMCRRHPHAVGD
jgi:glycine/D-amino acid oxidase-like deaminating enzyme